jgi:hypothetical protein
MDDVRMLNLVPRVKCALPARLLCRVTSVQVMQFLHERGFHETLEALSRETKHVMNIEGNGGQLCSILAEYEEMKMMEVTPEVPACSY